MERGEKARDARDARDGPPDQMATDNKISPSGRRAEAAPRRSVQCAPSNLSRANIPAEAILTPIHKGERHCWSPAKKQILQNMGESTIDEHSQFSTK